MSDELHSVSNALSQSWSEIQSQWSETNSKWRDNKGSAFENEYWSTFSGEMPDYIDGLHELMEAIRESQQKISE
jgi:uncharacterized protein YukE